MSHKSELLEQYIDKFVQITFRGINNTNYEQKGILKHTNKGWRPYKLVTKYWDFIFSKSEVIKIEEV